jgi:hypothetical protein
MQVKDPSIPLKGNAKDTVLSFISALNNEDYEKAREYVSDDIVFEGVNGAANNKDDYFKGLIPLQLKYEIIKTFIDGTDVCVLYNLPRAGTKIFTVGWYKIDDSGKINFLKVVFDPRRLQQSTNQ